MPTITFEFTGPQATATIQATQSALTALNNNHRVRRGDVGGEGVPTFKGRQNGGGPPVAGPPAGTPGQAQRTARQGRTDTRNGTDGTGTGTGTGNGKNLNRTLPADVRQTPDGANLKTGAPLAGGDTPTKLSSTTPPGGKPGTGSLLGDTPEGSLTGGTGGAGTSRLTTPSGSLGADGAERKGSAQVPDFGGATSRLDALAGEGEAGLRTGSTDVNLGGGRPGTGSLDLDQADFDRLGNLASDGATRLSGVNDSGGFGAGTGGITLPPTSLTGGAGLSGAGAVRVPSLGSGTDGLFGGGGGLGGGGLGGGGGSAGLSVPTGALTTGGIGGGGAGGSLLSGGSGSSGTGSPNGANLGAAAAGRAGAAGLPGGGIAGAPGTAGAPMMPMGGGGMGGAPQQGGKQENPNQSQTWLTEDEDVWGSDDDCHSGQLGRD